MLFEMLKSRFDCRDEYDALFGPGNEIMFGECCIISSDLYKVLLLFNCRVEYDALFGPGKEIMFSACCLLLRFTTSLGFLMCMF